MPRISVIIPTYNRAESVAAAIDSVLCQTIKEYELLVVDDGSTDKTVDSIEAMADERLRLLDQKHKGVSAARNLGITESNGEWIAFLDSDDLWHPEKLRIQIDFHQRHPEVFISQTQEKWIRNGNFVNPMRKHQKPSGYIFPQSLKMCAITPSSVMIHRKILDEIGLFDADLPSCEDYDLWLRLTARHRVELIDMTLLTKHGGHPDQLSSKYSAMDRFRIYSLFKILLAGTLNQEQRQQAIETCEKKVEILSNGILKRDQNPGDLIQLADEVYLGKTPFEDVRGKMAAVLLDDEKFKN